MVIFDRHMVKPSVVSLHLNQTQRYLTGCVIAYMLRTKLFCFTRCYMAALGVCYTVFFPDLLRNWYGRQYFLILV